MEYMIGKNNKQMINRKNGVRVESYAIKKFKVGTASVAVGAMIFLGTFISNGNDVHAKEMVEAPQIVTSTNAGSELQHKTEVSKNNVEDTKASNVGTQNKDVVKDVNSGVAHNIVETKPLGVSKPVVDTSKLKVSLQKMKSALQTYVLADISVKNTAQEQITIAENVLQNNKSQVDIDNIAVTLDTVSQTLHESHVQKESEKQQIIEKKHDNVTKELQDKKNELTKSVSEAEVTNTVAREKLRKENITATARESVENAVNKNEVAVTKANSVLSNDKASEHEITNSLTTLGSTITNVYKALENIGINNFSAVLSATEGYTLETTEKRHENGEFSTATGKSYEVLDNNSNYKLYVKGYQSENTDRPSDSNETIATGGRTDIPLSKTEAEKLRRESILWDGRIRPTGKNNNNPKNSLKNKDLEKYLTILNNGGSPTYGANGGL